MIQVSKLTKQYGDHVAVDQLSFTMESGQIHGFLGPNGAGKSTTMNMITGCLAPTGGDVWLDGVNVFDEPEKIKGKIGYLPEIPPVYPDMTPREYLSFVAGLKGIPKKQIPAAVEEALEATHITHMQNRLIGNLSKGYKQRVGISQAILGHPEIVILDEPTVGLDPRQILQIRALIKELGKRHTVILSSHILGEIQAVCDHITIIASGKLIACDSKENLEKVYSRRHLELACKADSAAVTAILAPLFPESALTFGADGEYTTVKADITESPIQPEAVFEAFSKANLPLHRLHTTEGSLEDLFLELTREGGSEL